MKFIALGPKEMRCRPAKGFQQLLNDCGMQGRCARRLASNTVGAPEDDLSKDCKPHIYAPTTAMTCPHYRAVE